MEISIDPRHLIHLVAVAEHGSFSRAAEMLHMSQPALSSSIATLESRLGARVLVRDRRGATPNSVGEALVRRGKELRSLMQAAINEARLLGSGEHGALAIGATPNMAKEFVPRVLQAMGGDALRGQVTVIEGLDDVLQAALNAGEIDVMLGPLFEGGEMTERLVWEELFAEQIMLCVSRDHKLARHTSICPEELDGLSWILPRQGSFYPRFVEALFLSVGVPWPEMCVYTNSLGFAEAMVARSNMVTPTSRAFYAGGNPATVAIPINGVGLRRIGLYMRREDRLSGLEKQFLDTVRAMLNGEV